MVHPGTDQRVTPLSIQLVILRRPWYFYAVFAFQQNDLRVISLNFHFPFLALIFPDISKNLNISKSRNNLERCLVKWVKTVFIILRETNDTLLMMSSEVSSSFKERGAGVRLERWERDIRTGVRDDNVAIWHYTTTALLAICVSIMKGFIIPPLFFYLSEPA